MSLKSQFKTNSSLVNDGVWFDAATNSDGSKCRIKLRRTGQANSLWSLAWRKHAKDDLTELTPDQDREFMAEVYADAVVADWEHFQPEDDGEDVPFSREAVVAILADPDWLEFRAWVRANADSLTPYQDKREEDAKN